MDLQLLRPASTVTYSAPFTALPCVLRLYFSQSLALGLWMNLEKECSFVLAIPAKTSFKALEPTCPGPLKRNKLPQN